MAEHVISLLKAIETCPEIEERECLNTGYLDECHPLIQQAHDAAMDYLIKENGERNYSHELDLEDAGFRVFCLEKDGFGWLAGGIETSKGVIAYG